MAARDQRLDRDAIADVDAPALGGAVADALDDAERLVPRDRPAYGTGSTPVYCSASLPQMPHASTRSSALSSSISGIGSSRSSSWRGPVWTMARLVRGGMRRSDGIARHVAGRSRRWTAPATLTGPGTPPRPWRDGAGPLTAPSRSGGRARCLADEPGAFLVEVPDPERPVTLVGCGPTAELCLRAERRSAGGASSASSLRRPRRCVPALPARRRRRRVSRLRARRRASRRAPIPQPPASARRASTLRSPPGPRPRRGQWSLVGTARRLRAPWLERLSRPAPAWNGPLATAPLTAAMPAGATAPRSDASSSTSPPGDCYQVNLTQPFRAPLVAPAWALLDSSRAPAPGAVHRLPRPRRRRS